MSRVTSLALAKSPPVIPTPPPAPTLVALRTAVEQQLRTMIDQGASSAVLWQIERFCHSAREALISIEQPQDMVRSRLGLGQIGLSNGYNISSSYMMSDADGVGPLAGAPGNETFGANVIRELIATATKLADKKTVPSLGDLVLSRNMAKATKNHKLVKLIDAQIEKLYAELEPTKKAPTKRKQRTSLRA